MKEYNGAANFVRPLPSDERQESLSLGGLDALVSSDSIHVGSPLAAHHGAHEQTSGMDRSKALIVRLAPFTGIWLILSIAVAWVAGMGAWWSLIVFASLTAITYGLMDRREYTYSRNGLERHKVDSLVYLKDKEIDNEHEIKLLVVRAQIEMWRAQRGFESGARTIEARERTIAGRIAGPAASDTEEDSG